MRANITRRKLLSYSAVAAGGIAARRSVSAAAVPTVRTRALEIAYHERGNSGGIPVILMHGFPDDAHAYDGVTSLLAKQGFRTFAPYLRGYGSTKFLDAAAPRKSQQAAIGQDAIDFADALGLRRFIVCGYDWGGRAAGIAAALYPDRVSAAVLIGGYTIRNTVTANGPPDLAAIKAGWYQWYFGTDAGRRGLEQYRRELGKFLWHDWSPTWQFTEATYELTAASFDNPDFVDCVVHSYQHRNFMAAGEPRFEDMERRLAARPKIEVPTVVLHGGDSGLNRRPPEATAEEKQDFTKLVARRIVDGAGHFLPHEKPAVVAAAVLEAHMASR